MTSWSWMAGCWTSQPTYRQPDHQWGSSRRFRTAWPARRRHRPAYPAEEVAAPGPARTGVQQWNLCVEDTELRADAPRLKNVPRLFRSAPGLVPGQEPQSSAATSWLMEGRPLLVTSPENLRGASVAAVLAHGLGGVERGG